MFITFEGIDASGKSTQAHLLESRFKREGFRTLLVREPGGTALSEAVRTMLLHSHGELDARAEFLLFSAARAELVSKVLLPELGRGTIVICDRFYDSSTAYQGYGRGLPLDEIEHVNRLASHEVVPDLTFYLDVSLANAAKRRATNGTRDRIEQAGDAFYERVLKGYQKIAEQHRDRFHVVDGAEGSPEEIHESIWRIVQYEMSEHHFA